MAHLSRPALWAPSRNVARSNRPVLRRQCLWALLEMLPAVPVAAAADAGDKQIQHSEAGDFLGL